MICGLVDWLISLISNWRMFWRNEFSLNQFQEINNETNNPQMNGADISSRYFISFNIQQLNKDCNEIKNDLTFLRFQFGCFNSGINSFLISQFSSRAKPELKLIEIWIECRNDAEWNYWSHLNLDKTLTFLV